MQGGIPMERVNKILKSEAYLNHYKQIEAYEKTREYCKHDLGHFLDVARIAYSLYLEEADAISSSVMQSELVHETMKELIYATALLHDIGRLVQYEQGIGHEIASAQISPQILENCGFTSHEIPIIVDSILKHRAIESRPRQDLVGWIYRADKFSRPCFGCNKLEFCDRAPNKKQMVITY